MWGNSVSSYQVRVYVRRPYEPGLGVVAKSSEASASVCAGLTYFLPKDEDSPILIRSCSSTEGIHLTAWRECRRIWHEYYYLPYEVIPDCTDEEVGDDRGR